jgi:hypothetical protein
VQLLRQLGAPACHVSACHVSTCHVSACHVSTWGGKNFNLKKLHLFISGAARAGAACCRLLAPSLDDDSVSGCMPDELAPCIALRVSCKIAPAWKCSKVFRGTLQPPKHHTTRASHYPGGNPLPGQHLMIVRQCLPDLLVCACKTETLRAPS